MRQIAVLFFALLCFVGLRAQGTSDSVEVEIKVGDSIEIGTCKGDHYQHLDFYKKTRWSPVATPYDTATGSGFYASFFATGDFDIAELPATFKGKTFVVLGVEVLGNKKTGKPMHVLYLKGPQPNTVIWVDFYEAVDAGEIKFIRYQIK
jgi:hypothetical protein